MRRSFIMAVTKHVKTLADVINVLGNCREELLKTYHVKEIGIFGSYTSGEQRRSSDIDILVAFTEPVGLFKFLELEEHLASLLGVKVDLVTRGALKPHIGERILKEVIYL